MILPMNSGAEAVGTALKATRKWGDEIKGTPDGRVEIITCACNSHGRTITIVGFSPEAHHGDGFGPFTPGFITVPCGDAQALEDAITPHRADFLVEPIRAKVVSACRPRAS